MQARREWPEALDAEAAISAITAEEEGEEDVVRDELTVSITRKNHLCALLGERLSRPGLCSVRRVSRVLGLIPDDGYARGAIDFTQPAVASPFFFAAAQSVCEAVALTVVQNNGQSLFRPNDLEASLDRMVSLLMSIPSSSDRYQHSIDTLRAYYERLRADEIGALNALRSVFTTACLSPDVMGVGL